MLQLLLGETQFYDESKIVSSSRKKKECCCLMSWDALLIPLQAQLVLESQQFSESVSILLVYIICLFSL